MTKTKSSAKSPMLDLHGENLLDLESKVDRFLTQAQNKGLNEIRIMTDKGPAKFAPPCKNI